MYYDSQEWSVGPRVKFDATPRLEFQAGYGYVHRTYEHARVAFDPLLPLRDDREHEFSLESTYQLDSRNAIFFVVEHDTVDEIAQTDTRDWKRGEVPPIPGKTMPKFRVVERQFKERRWREHFVDLATGDLRPVPENWSRDRIAWVKQQYELEIIRKKVERIRWAVICSDVTMHYDWSPYKHFSPVPYFPFFRHGTTIGRRLFP